MNLDNKEFLAVKASDIVRLRHSLEKLISKEITAYKNKKLMKDKVVNQKEIESIYENPFEHIVSLLEGLGEHIQEALWIDELGDDIK